MKKLLLSALAISMMFVSCDKNSNDPAPTPQQPTTPQPTQPTQPITIEAKDFSAVFPDIKNIQDNMYKQSSAELINTFDKFKSDVASSSVEDITNYINGVKPDGKATKGNAGKLGSRYLTAKGIENGQLIKKGFIGAFQLHQAVTYGSYLRGNLSKEDQEKVLKGFTTALLGDYSYIDNKKDEKGNYPAVDGNEFAKYLNTVSTKMQGFEGKNDDLYNALKEAKKNLGNQQVVTENIMKALDVAQKVIAIRCVYYLKVSEKLNSNNLSDSVAHNISEGLGFVYSLQYTYKMGSGPYFSREEVMGILNNLDLWDGDASQKTLNDLSRKIAKAFDIKWEEV